MCDEFLQEVVEAAPAGRVLGPEDIADALATHEEFEEELSEVEEEEEPAVREDVLDAPAESEPSPLKKKKGVHIASYTYPWPDTRRPEEGPPPFVSHNQYAEAADAAEEAGKRGVTARRAAAVQYGVNFTTCLRLLPYFDIVRGFAMDKLHDIDLGPIKGALEQTFGRANETEKPASPNGKLKIRLPLSVGRCVSERLLTMKPKLPSELSIRLRSPCEYHQYYIGTCAHECAFRVSHSHRG